MIAGKIGGIGFCFGGAMVLELARSGADIKGVASFHGNLSSKQPAAPGAVKAAVLAMNGADDAFVPAEQIAGFQKEIRDAGCKYHEPSYRRSVAMMRDFFGDLFAGK